jgi:hypothetical protein
MFHENPPGKTSGRGSHSSTAPLQVSHVSGCPGGHSFTYHQLSYMT